MAFVMLWGRYRFAPYMDQVHGSNPAPLLAEERALRDFVGDARSGGRTWNGTNFYTSTNG